MGDTRLEPLVLSDAERRTLENWAKRRKTAQGLALRARIVLACADGGPNIAVAARLGINRATVRKWRTRFLARRLDGLGDEPRPGVPRTISDAQVEEVVVRTLEEVPEGATHWSRRELAKRVGISPSSVHRIWRAFGLQPWRAEDFKISPDPLLIDKIRDVVGLYLAPPANAAVFAVDEKPQIQALERTSPVLPMLPGVPERRSHDYVRHGTIDLFAALNTATGKVIGKLSAQHRAVDFRDFLDEIDRQTAPGLAIHVICDNLSAHKAPVVHKWLLAHPRVQLHFTPTYSSWISQVERWFAELQRRCPSSPPHWRTGSRPGTAMPGPSSGPRPPTRSSTASAATAHASPNRDTSCRRYGRGGGDRCSAGYLARRIVMDLRSMRAGCLRWRPVAGQFVQPPGVVARIELPMLLHGPVKVVADHGCDHVHDVVPVVAEGGEPLHRLPCPGRVIGQQLARDNLVHRDVQPRAERLTVDDHLFIAAERVFEFCVLRLDQEREFVLVCRIQ